MWQRQAFLFNMMLAIGGLLLSQTTVSFSQPFSEEYIRKADLLYHFARFIEWPRTSYGDEDHFVIGVLGEDPFRETLLDALSGKSIDGRQIKIERYADVSTIGSCQILYISPAESDHMKEILQGLNSRSILTVGEGSEFAQSGGMIAFVEHEGTRFEINASTAEAAHLSISSKLLGLAKVVW